MGEFFEIEVKRGNNRARLDGFNHDNLSLLATHRFAGALMPALQAARARGSLTRLQYKRAKSQIEARMRENMQYDREHSWPYGTVLLRDVRDEIAAMVR